MKDDPTISVYVSRKVNLGDYESIDIFVKWDSVPITVGREFLEDTAKVTMSMIETVAEQIKDKAARERVAVSREREERRKRGGDW